MFITGYSGSELRHQRPKRPQGPLRRLPRREIRNSTMKMRNKALATDAAPAAMPKNPSAPAIIAIMRKITVQRNMGFCFW